MNMATKNRKYWHGTALVSITLAFASFACAGDTVGRSTGTGGKGTSTGSGGAATGSGGSAAGSGGSSSGGGGSGSGGSNGAGGSSNGSGGSSGGASGQVALPMIVTSYYNNQGWFGDAAVTAFFTPGSTVIRQASSSAGPCAARQTPALGNCLEVVYTPPAALVQPPAGTAFVGVFLLTTLTMAHPTLTPPQNVGDANWGDELGKNIAPGANNISFRAAAATDGLVVIFKAGTANDSFTLPELPETLGTSWKAYSMSIAGISYGSSVAGAFAWVLKDTSKPATFYVDGIVWE